MGSMEYAGQEIQIDDRLLTHLQVVVIGKLRRGEPFLMSWVNTVSSGSGRAAIWLHPNFPVQFRFAGSRVPQINAEWVQRLRQSADSSTGLIVTGEDGWIAPIERMAPVRRARAMQMA